MLRPTEISRVACINLFFHRPSKKGIINKIFGSKNNGELARTSYSAKILSKNITKLKNSEKDSEDRKELGQQYTYAISLLQRNK